MTGVIYARYSSDNQREESTEGQIRECTACAEQNGITVLTHYIDRALSARSDMLNAIMAGILTSSAKQRLEEPESRTAQKPLCLFYPGMAIF